VSSKAKRRRRAREQRKKLREEGEMLNTDWVCPRCNYMVPGFSPVCLCGWQRHWKGANDG
jgi:transcription elongation factor Elf1